MMELIYTPIIKKLDNWIEYMETSPKGMSYAHNKDIFDEHRKTHDLDCILTNGNLNADTIISLWIPLKTVIYDNASRNNKVYEALGLEANNAIYKKIDVLKKIKENIEIILPKDEPTTRLLTRLFILGQQRCNVMILPDRKMNSMRGRNPYKDYMPYFLKECFEGGAFASFFSGDEDFICWVLRENLETFFEDGVIKPDRIKDLACSGDLKNSKPGDIETYLKNYENILENIKEKRTTEGVFMEGKHIFNKETDSEMLAMEIVTFLRKWGMWQDVQIFTGGKCYSDKDGELLVRDEAHPEKYLKGTRHYDCNGHRVWKDLSNPERFLDMTFEGPLSLLLRHHEYEVKIGDVSDEVRRIIVPLISDVQDKVGDLVTEYLEGKYSWDPAEFDSYEEWLELNQYCNTDRVVYKQNDLDGREIEFSSKEEYEDFLMHQAVEREYATYEYFEDEICDETEWNRDIFYDNGRIASMIIEEFNDLLKKYGLWYELCFSWSLTMYRIQ